MLLPMSPVEAILNRYKGGAAYLELALGELESELLRTETDDQLARRVRHILKNFQRLVAAPPVEVKVKEQHKYVVILDPEGD